MESQKKSTNCEIHGVVFDNSLPQKLMEAMINWKIQGSSLLSQSKWQICGTTDIKTFVQDGWKQILSLMVSAPCKYLRLNYNGHQNIIMDISETNFLQLKHLDLMKKKIWSIEQLQFANMPVLEWLNLWKNNITKVSALNKCSWSSLSYLDLCQNPILQNSLERLKTAAQAVQEIPQEQVFYLQIDWQSQRMVSKLFFTQMKSITSYDTILQNKLIKCLERKLIKFERN